REHRLQHRTAGSPADCIGRVAIETVLADIEIEGREIHGAEIVQRCEESVEIVVFGRMTDNTVEFPQTMQTPAFDLRLLFTREPLRYAQAGQAAEQIAQ